MNDLTSKSAVASKDGLEEQPANYRIVRREENDETKYVIWRSNLSGTWNLAIYDKRIKSLVSVNIKNVAYMLQGLPNEAFL